MSQTIINERIAVGAATLSVDLCGTGEAVVLLPSWARGTQDFADLMTTLAAAGFRALAVNPRGIQGSTGPLTGITLHDLAADVAGILEALDAAPAHIIGHAFGNRIARCLATDRPALVKTVTLLAAGGLVAPQREMFAALEQTFTTELSDTAWLTAIRTSHFAARGDRQCCGRVSACASVVGCREACKPHLTIACRRPPTAYAPTSLLLSAAPDAWR